MAMAKIICNKNISTIYLATILIKCVPYHHRSTHMMQARSSYEISLCYLPYYGASHLNREYSTISAI
jgi:hypothetical protein